MLGMRPLPILVTFLALLVAGCVTPGGRDAQSPDVQDVPSLNAQHAKSTPSTKVVTETYEATWTAQVGSPATIMSFDGTGWPRLSVPPFLAANATFEWSTTADTGPMRVGFQDEHGSPLWDAEAYTSPGTFSFPENATELRDATHFFAGPASPGAAGAVTFTLTLEFLLPPS